MASSDIWQPRLARSPMLSDAQKHALVDLARRSVVATVTGSAPPTFSLALPGASGVFVTIKRRGELRGCLGTLQCQRGLAGEIVRCAAESATEDPRFPPVSVDELVDLAVEVSVLGPLEPVDPREPDAIVIGRHGLVAERGFRRGLLLPQVATEWGWTVEQFLRQTCLKAGLEQDAWQRDAQMSRFEAEVFGE
jgi:AmmeMemoRadiSam system protein A